MITIIKMELWWKKSLQGTGDRSWLDVPQTIRAIHPRSPASALIIIWFPLAHYSLGQECTFRVPLLGACPPLCCTKADTHALPQFPSCPGALPAHQQCFAQWSMCAARLRGCTATWGRGCTAAPHSLIIPHRWNYSAPCRPLTHASKERQLWLRQMPIDSTLIYQQTTEIICLFLWVICPKTAHPQQQEGNWAKLWGF